MITSTALQTANTVMVSILLIISFLVTVSFLVDSMSADTVNTRNRIIVNISLVAITLILFYVFLLLMLR